MARNPSLTADELAHARAVARANVDELGSQTAAVERLGVSKAALSDLLNGGSVGMKLVAALSRATGRSIDEVLGHASSGAPRVGRSELASLPGYPEALAELVEANARSLRPFPADIFDEAATLSMSRPPSRVTPEFLRRVCEALIQAREDASRDETEALRTEAAKTPRR